MARRTSSTRSNTCRPHRAMALIAALAMAASPIAWSVLSPLTGPAAGLPSAQAQASRPVHSSPNEPKAARPLTAGQKAEVEADQRATARAKALGRPVAVSSATTPVSSTVARPNGTFTTTTHALPVRVKLRGHWVNVNAQLTRTAAGWQPRAVQSPVTFSAGGNGPSAIMTSPYGTLALTFPGRLPAPSVRGSTATYAGVLPGVDLELTATTLGGFDATLIVLNAQAAASPAVRNLRLAVAATDLIAATDKTGNIAVRKPGVGWVFSGPAATMSDSPSAAGLAAAPGGAAAGAAAGAELHPALRNGQLALNADPALLGQASIYPAYISLQLTQDNPVPPVRGHGPGRGNTPATFNNSVTMARAHYIETQSGCPTAKNYDTEPMDTQFPSLSGNGVGYNWWPGGCDGIYRSYYSFDTSASNPNWIVLSAQLSLFQTYSADGACAHNWPITAYSVGQGTTFQGSDDWNTFNPTMNSSNQQGNTQSLGVGEPSCGNNTATFDVSSALQSAANNGADYWSFGFKGNENSGSGNNPVTNSNCTGSSNCGLNRFGINPKVVTTYDEAPATPTSPNTVPETINYPGQTNTCAVFTGGEYPWLGATDPDNASNGVSLSVSLAAPALTDEQVTAKYQVIDLNTGASHSFPSDNTYPDGGNTNTALPFTLSDGSSYSWHVSSWVNANGGDNGFSSPPTTPCLFSVDETAPSEPTVTSTDFPSFGAIPGTKLTTGQSGKFNFSGYDPVPSNSDCSQATCAASGVYEYEYELGSPPPQQLITPTTASNCPAGGVTLGEPFAVLAGNSPGTPSNPATATSCPITPGNWGSNTLYVQAIDVAGNYSVATQYQFYVPWNGKPAALGDVNGDGFPDLLATTTSGNLVIYPGHKDPHGNPRIASVPADSPQPGIGWNNYDITHRGSFSQQAVDDLFALRGSNLYRYLNNTDSGTPPQFENPSNLRLVSYPSCPTLFENPDPSNSANCAGYPSGWSQFSQIVAPGDAWAGDPQGTASQPFSTFGITEDDKDPSLLGVTKSGQLWLFQGNGAGQLQDPVLLGSGGWNNMTVIAPGVVNGQNALWARDTTKASGGGSSAGELFSYPFVPDSNGVPTLNPASPSNPPAAESAYGTTTATLIPGAPNLTAAAYPTVTAAMPLATGTGSCGTGNPGYYCPGLFAEDFSGNIWYYSGQPVAGSGGPLVNSNPTLYASTLKPAAYWPLGDSQSGSCLSTAADATGNNFPGTINGTVTCVPDPANSGEPTPELVDDFDGSTGYIATANPVLDTDSSGSFTVSAWVYLSNFTNDSTALSQSTSAGDTGGSVVSAFKLMMRQQGGSNYWAFSRPASNAPGTPISALSAPLSNANLNTWTQLTGTYTASTGLMTLYVNGQSVATATDTTPFASTGPTLIGADIYNGLLENFFAGDVKDAQVYDYSLSSSQVGSLYQSPVASLPLDGPIVQNGTTTPDVTGDGYSATINGGLTWGGDADLGVVASLDGTSGFAATAEPVLATGAGDSFSVSAWVNLSSNAGMATAVSQDTATADPGGVAFSGFKLMYRTDSNAWAFTRPTSNQTGSGVISALSTPLTSQNLNTWTQLTGTYNASTGLMSLYVNGDLAGTVTDTTPFASSGSTVIGRDLYNGSPTDFFPGEISDVQLFNYALTENAVKALYFGKNPISQIS